MSALGLKFQEHGEMHSTLAIVQYFRLREYMYSQLWDMVNRTENEVRLLIWGCLKNTKAEADSEPLDWGSSNS